MSSSAKSTVVNSTKTILKTIPFDVEECEVTFNGEKTDHPFYRLAIRDWVNVLAITKEGKAVLIYQDRVGAEENILEAPGGVIETDENIEPKEAALRELEEETGYTSDEMIFLGKINPNPAINTNNVHFYLAKNAYIPVQRNHFPDKYEQTENKLVSIAELKSLVKNNQINHALSALLIYKALEHLS
jgi:8-oxo-dGTP pyrophosphatase MutT (NUDIX family)